MRYVAAESVPVYASVVLAAIATAVLIGWAFDIEPLMTVFPGLIRMKPNTAAAFLLAAAGLYSGRGGRHNRVQAACSALLILLGFITLSEFVWHFDAHIDELLFRDPVPSPVPGRMAPITAVNFVLTGTMLYPFRFRNNEKFTDLLALIVCLGSTFAMVGYFYGVPILYGSIHYTSMAIHTGFSFLAVSLGYLFIRKRNGFGRIFLAQTSGGVVVRWLVPPAVLVPIALGGIFIHVNFGQLRLGIAFIVLSNVVLAVASIWSLARILDKSEVEKGTAQQASENDALTGIHNRRYFDLRLREEIQRCVRHSREACLILFDVDHFKSLNDRFGHPAGDEVLRTIAQTCAKNLRATDVMCRYGGEEFAVIAPETAPAEAMVLARKIRTLVAGLRFAGATVPVTISLGVAKIGKVAPSSELAIAAADKALFEAKEMGRNREVLYGAIGQGA